MNQIDNDTLLLLLFLACELFILVVFVVVRLLFPPIEPFELNKADREHIERVNRDKQSS